MPYEIEDQAFFPPMLRQQQLEAISFMVRLMNTYKPLIYAIKSVLQNTGVWTDCCTGAAGPVVYLLQQGCEPHQLILVDRFVHLKQESIPHRNTMLVEADVLKTIPGNGMITMFNAFHHFTQDQQKEILRNIAAEGRPLVIAEITRPGLLNFISITLAATLLQILTAPFIKPFNWSRLLLTYVIPINIITVLWDGWMSVLFGMKKSQFKKLAAHHSDKRYAFTFKTYGPFWQKVYCLHGAPAQA